MATQIQSCVFQMAFPLLFLLASAFVSVHGSTENTKTIDFNVKPGGVVHTFTEGMNWLMSVGLSDDNTLFSCSVWRPQKSYLFFTQFKAELKGTKIEYANAYSEAASSGKSDVPLKPEEFTVGDSTVTHTEGKFSAQLSKLTAIGRTRHVEL